MTVLRTSGSLTWLAVAELPLARLSPWCSLQVCLGERARLGGDGSGPLSRLVGDGALRPSLLRSEVRFALSTQMKLKTL
jgi:hypothetical protein